MTNWEEVMAEIRLKKAIRIAIESLIICSFKSK